VYELDVGECVEVDVPSGRGADLKGFVRAERIGDTVKIDRWGAVDIASVRLLLEGFSVTDVHGARLHDGEIVVEKGAKEVVLHLRRD